MLTKLVITICEMIILTHKTISGFYIKYWWRCSTLKIKHFEDMDNLMKMLIPLFPNCALAHTICYISLTGPNLVMHLIESTLIISQYLCLAFMFTMTGWGPCTQQIVPAKFVSWKVVTFQFCQKILNFW